ncbi:uncharacterized protein LOC134210884 [Armigeres subalbatus]|uniref:uncharacterized protein LOC134210884 n=1 Tax=Armigeres subalbatus TaxID=124917 RepID=UPI002ECFDE89
MGEYESLSKNHDSKSQFSSKNSESIIDNHVMISREAVTPSREPERARQNAIEIKSRFEKNDAQSNSSLSVEVCESLNKNDDSKSHFTSRNLESIVDSKVLITREAVTPSRESERVLQNAIEIKSRFKKDDAQSNSSLSVEACEGLNKNDDSKSHFTSEKLESIVDSNVVITEADSAQLKNDIIEHSTKTLENNEDKERRKSLITTLPEIVVKSNETSEVINGYVEPDLKFSDRERSQQYAPTADTKQSKNHNPNDESFSSPVQHKPTEDCNEFQHESELNVTAGDVRRKSPISRQTFGSFQFPRHIDASNTSSTSLAWSYLPQLSTSHSTSSLASLRSNSCNTAAASQSPVQRRQLKSYAQRHHRSSFHVLPN